MSLARISVAVVLVAATLAAGEARAAEHTYRSEHFALTWSADRSDPDAPALQDRDGDGVPDAVARMTSAFEDARSFLLDDLGYQEPPTRGRYNLYLSSAIDRGLVRPAPGGNGRSKPSFVTIPTYLMRASADAGQVRSFAVHEYFHAVQIGYDATEDSWIKEASSTWVEGLFEPEAGHNQVYLFDFVPRLELGLTSAEGVHEYGAFLFLQFLTERHGGPPEERAILVRELWEAMAVPEAIPGAPDDDSLGALQRVLNARGVALRDAWDEFLVWAWQLNRFERGDEYRRALRDQRWPTAPATPVTDETCRLTPDAPEGALPALAGDYVRFKPTSPRPTSARLVVRGPIGATAFTIVRPLNGAPIVRRVVFDADGVGALDIELGEGQVPRIILGVGNASTTSSPVEYSLRLSGADAVTADPPSVPSSTIFGTGFTATGRVYCDGAPAPFARVVVTATEVSSGVIETFDLTTDAFGQWALVVAPAVTTTYSADVVDPLLSPDSSAAAVVGVRVAVNMAIDDDQVAEGEAVIVHGNVAPTHPGTVVLEYRRPNGAFETGADTRVDSDGSYRFDFVLPAPGVWEVRTTMPQTGDADHLPGDSAPKLVQVGES